MVEGTIRGCEVRVSGILPAFLPPHVQSGGQQAISRLASLARNLTIVIVAALVLAACGKKAPVIQPPPEIRTVEVSVPVPVKLTPPAELLAPVNPPLPTFISPFDPEATSALTAESERLLRGLIEELLQRLEAWKKWAEAKEP